MKKRFYLFALLMAASTFIFNGCKKKDDPEPTKTELLTNKNWKLTALTSNPPIDNNGTQVSDIYALLQDCSKDDLTKFLTSGIVNFDEGATKCSQSDPQTTTGTWAFNATQTVISITDNGTTDSYTIVTLSENTLKATSIFDDGTNLYTFTHTFTKQ